MNFPSRRCAFLIFVLVMFTTAACSPPKKKRVVHGPPPQGENVLLIVIEALPANRLGCYGGDKTLTPNLDKMARNGILFEKFHSASPWTMPSFGSILSGMPPGLHGAGRFLPGKGKSSAARINIHELNPQAPFLPVELKDVVSTIIVNNYFVHEDYGFERGWTNYDQNGAGFSGYRRAQENVRIALRNMRRHQNDSHFMLLHFFDTHVPYVPIEPYQSEFSRGKKGRLNMRTYRQFKQIRDKEFVPTKEEQQYLRGLQDGEIAYTDKQIGNLLVGMESLGVLKNTWIIITADHGEELFEHGEFEHGHRFEEEVTKVPLIIFPPGGEWKQGKRVKYAARHIDLAPTILKLMGKDVPERMEGKDLMPLITGKEKEHRSSYMSYPLSGEQLHAYFDGHYKIIEMKETKKMILYDLETDPLEKKQLEHSHPEFERMEKLLMEAATRYRGRTNPVVAPREKKTVSKEVLDSLRSLGYIE